MSNSPAEPASLELALIGFVEDAPRHGYEIYQLLTGTPELHRIWRMKQSRLYAMLARLEDAELLRSDVVMQAGRPPRKLLRPTEAGASAFQTWRTQPVAQPREMRLEFMLKLYFALRHTPQTAQQLVSAQQAVCAGWPEMRPDPADGPFLHAVVVYRRAHIAAIRDWLASLATETLLLAARPPSHAERSPL
ncbi:MAG: PadR family transcriptional regulator [Candidatus Promineofilum sp.]|nr:PadR family transcriptional regulator [Promineifilum sp.]MCW5864136.1 PadR family transcriptional regulator [Anaerolineae bacterium]